MADRGVMRPLSLLPWRPTKPAACGRTGGPQDVWRPAVWKLLRSSVAPRRGTASPLGGTMTTTTRERDTTATVNKSGYAVFSSLIGVAAVVVRLHGLCAG